jgi:hypothetical protein
VVRWFVICVAFAAGACGRHGEAELEHVRDAVCSCKTASCADQAMKKLPQQDIASNPTTQRIAREMMDCLARLYENGRPSTDPDGPIQEASGPPPPAPPPPKP